MNSSLRITRVPYEEPYHVNLVLEVSNGQRLWEFEIYDNAQSLVALGENLKAFPRHRDDEFLWELGSECPEDRWAYYFRFRVVVTDGADDCAIQIRFNNNKTPLEGEVVEFCMEAEPAQIKRLGQLCLEFGKLKHELLVWEGDNGALFESRYDA